MWICHLLQQICSTETTNPDILSGFWYFVSGWTVCSDFCWANLLFICYFLIFISLCVCVWFWCWELYCICLLFIIIIYYYCFFISKCHFVLLLFLVLGTLGPSHIYGSWTYKYSHGHSVLPFLDQSSSFFYTRSCLMFARARWFS